MKVSNFESNTGNKIANQFIIEESGKSIFQSYNSVIAVIENCKTTLDEKMWDYSTTTGKYRNQFLNETKKETEKKISSGEYKLSNLN